MTTLQPALAGLSEPAFSAAQPAAPASPTVSARTWVAVLGATLGAFMAVLDIMIANASLPYIEGGISTGGVGKASPR